MEEPGQAQGAADGPAGARRADLTGGALVALSSIQFGTVAVLGKVAIEHGAPLLTTLSIRFAICALLLAGSLRALRQPLAAAKGERLWLLLLGAVGYGVEASLFFAGLHHGTAAAITLLFFTYPVFVALASLVLGRGGPTGMLWLALVCGVAGAAVVAGAAGGIDVQPLGVVLAIASAVTYSAYLLSVDRMISRTHPLTSSMWVAGAASAGLGGYALVTGSAAVPVGWGQWGPIIGMAVATAGAFVCLLEGLRRLGAVRTSIVSSSEPLAAALLAYLVLGEGVAVGTAAGGAMIVVGAVVASLARVADPAEPPIP